MIALTGLSHLLLGPGDEIPRPDPFLKERKTKKYLGRQDVLAVVCAGRALEMAGLHRERAPERTGLFLAVGLIPFMERDIVPVLDASRGADDEFSMTRFAAGGYQKAHPLLAFRCLPNMPAYHIAANFDVQGPYVVTYPGPGQLYLALEEARDALLSERVDVALVCGVADQQNFLVRHHFARLDPPVSDASLRDAGAVMVLERPDDARARGARIVAHLAELRCDYHPFDPREQLPEHRERFATTSPSESTVPCGAALADLEVGPASLPLALGLAWAGAAEGEPRPTALEHHLQSRDGIGAYSRWTTPRSERSP